VGPSVSISQENDVEQKLITAGYFLFKASGNFKLLRSDLSAVDKKLRDLNATAKNGRCHISILAENILLVETICAYESILLGTINDIRETKKQEQFSLHHARLKEDILERLYLNYKSFQSNYAKIDDKLILEVADRAKEEMVIALQVVEHVIHILQPQR
jgi:hypothetical protein